MSDGGLSTGSGVGIGIGSVLFFIIVIAVNYMLYNTSQNKKDGTVWKNTGLSSVYCYFCTPCWLCWKSDCCGCGNGDSCNCFRIDEHDNKSNTKLKMTPANQNVTTSQPQPIDLESNQKFRF